MRLRLPVAGLLDRLRSAARRAGRPWQVLSARRAVRRAAPGLDPARAALRQFDTMSAGEFTALADGLTALDRQLSVVRAQSARLESTLRDHDEDHALSSAFTLYKKSVDLAHASIGIALSQEEEMEQMEGGLLSQQAAFTRTNLMFRVLVMNLRAEAARIDPEHRAVFVSVASEMEQMERRMGATLETAFTQLEAIVADATAGRLQLTQLRDQLHADAQRSIRLLRGEFDGITARLQPCLASSREVTRLLDAAGGHMGELITSLQYQDIVRQQLEHVAEGLADVGTHLAPAARAGRLDLGYLAQAVRVQQFNLASSRTAIEQAAGQITRAGTAVLGTGAELVALFGTMEREAVGVFHGSRLGELFQAETAKLVATAGQSEATNDRITRLLGRIEQSIGVFSSELMQQELDVHLVALNAQVAAARLPEARALNKLAEETSVLARESATLSRAMSAQLGETLARLNGMRQEADEVRSTIGREKADLAQGSVTVSDKLARFNERIASTSAEVARQFSTAYQNLGDLIASLRFPGAIPASFAPAEELCAALAAATATHLGTEAHAALAGHHDRYTMQQERAAHAAALGREHTPDEVEAVELFGSAHSPALSLSPSLEAAPGPSPLASSLSPSIDLFDAPAPPATGEAPQPDSAPSGLRSQVPALPAAPVAAGGDIELF